MNDDFFFQKYVSGFVGIAVITKGQSCFVLRQRRITSALKIEKNDGCFSDMAALFICIWSSWPGS
jgi:energy-converting hydrogenase Eha subunit G